MFPQRDLSELAARKNLLRRGIAESRLEISNTARGLGETLDLVDRGWSLWRQLAPFIKLAGASVDSFFPRAREKSKFGFRTLLRWAPVILETFKKYRKKSRDHGDVGDTEEPPDPKS